ncbi:hypothetical protein GYMC52_0248 [Geobacillus sp. Y412MC52]|nr:hypothetical protein GYMC52_0248 [Geobacillus sp. Y412MC52]ALA70630.1 hypothetical protein GT50_10910 [Geobacillus stearothermophilus 10]
MRPNAVFQAMIHRSQFQCRLQCSEGLLNIHQLLIPDGDIFGRQGVVRCPDEIFAVVLFRATNRLLVDAKGSVLQLAQVFSVGRMGTQPAGRLMMGFVWGLVFHAEATSHPSSAGVLVSTSRLISFYCSSVRNSSRPGAKSQ